MYDTSPFFTMSQIFSTVHRLCVIGSPLFDRDYGRNFTLNGLSGQSFFDRVMSGGLSEAIRSPHLLLEMEYFRWNSQKFRVILKG